MIDTQTHPHQLFIDTLIAEADWYKNQTGFNLSQTEFIVKNGFLMNTHFEVATQDEVLKLLKKYKCPTPQMKQCYYNAFKLWLESKIRGDFRFVYCEGKARKSYSTSNYSFLHGWLIDLQTNKIIDPTWWDAEECLYFGVPFTHKYRGNHANIVKQADIIDSDYKWGFRLTLEKDLWTDFRYDFGPELNKKYFNNI